MGINSCLYECRVFHSRIEPKRHEFVRKLLLFYLDLDELGDLAGKLKRFGLNRFNLFDFRDRDHLSLGPQTVKENILRYLSEKGTDLSGGKIMLLTQPRMLGYVFNPVSFYFCFDASGQPACAVAEIKNTCREMKLYFLGPETLKQDRFEGRQDKLFYISPFSGLDTVLDFSLRVPGALLELSVAGLVGGKRFFLAGLAGEKRRLNDRHLLRFFLRNPLQTFGVIFLIHWHRLILFLKKTPWHAKHEYPELQREVLSVRGRS